MQLTDPLALLHRTDKWYLGNGGLLLYAPPFPRYLGVPGFWDECHFGDLALPRLLCISFALEVTPKEYAELAGVDESLPVTTTRRRGRILLDLDPYLSYWDWQPDRIEAKHYLVLREGQGYKQQRGVRVFVKEIRTIAPDGTARVDLGFELLGGHPAGPLHVVAWTARQRTAAGENHSTFTWDGRALSYMQQLAAREHGRGRSTLGVRVEMSGSARPASVQVTPSHGANLVPRLAYTPLWDSLVRVGRISDEVTSDNILGSVTYAGLHWKLNLSRQRSPKLSIIGRVQLAADESRTVPTMTAPSGGYHHSLQTPDAARAWREFIALVPHFECSDPLLTRYYWYRWYGLRLNALAPGGNYHSPAVAEGISYFRGVISYSLMCHLYECKWLADPALASGCIEAHLAHQAPAGHFAGHIYLNHRNARGFYHTDVGRSLAELEAHHPAVADTPGLYRGLVKLLRYYVDHRDPEGSGLFDIWDQYETGQEFTSRYFHADESADLYGWEHKLRLKGVDVTTYVYHLLQLLSARADRPELKALRQDIESLVARTRAAVRKHMWDSRRGYFYDYSQQKRRRSPYAAAVGSYPLLSDLATDEQALAAAELLGSRDGFAASWPTPTVAASDPYFESDPRWRGERANCPWNGRVWPMVNSHITEVYARLAEINPRRYRPQLAKYLRRFVELMHFEQHGASAMPKDTARPNCFEHYNPDTGTASEYRGIDDYMHSWVADLILKYVAGVRVQTAVGVQGTPGHLVIDPLPFGLDSYLLRGAVVAGRRIDAGWRRMPDGSMGNNYRIWVDGELVYKSAAPSRIELEL